MRRERELYHSLLELGAHDEPESFVKNALQILVELTNARQGYLELRDDELTSASWWAAEGCEPDRIEEIRKTTSTGIIAHAIATGQTVLTASASEDPRFQDLTSVRDNEIESVLCTPIGRDTPLGVVYLQGDRSSRDFSPFDGETQRAVEFVARALAPLADRLVERTRRVTLSSRGKRQSGFEHVVGSSQGLDDVLQRLALVAKLDVHVLLTGASGTGKTLLGQAIHAASPRRPHAFVELNCAAIPDALLENELFGAAPGAHSAVPRQGVVGKVEAAQGGTLFLDEVGELSMVAQAKLLQLIQDKTYYRLGSAEARRADIRLVAATNQDLPALVKERKFREDLYYRLKVFEARVPSLVERHDDLVPLARHFAKVAAKRHDLPLSSLAPSAIRAIVTATWPGNVRELAHRVESAVLNAHLRSSTEITDRDIFPEADATPAADAVESLQEATRRFQRAHVTSMLETSNWNVSEAARRLDVARSYVYTLIRSYGLRRLDVEP